MFIKSKTGILAMYSMVINRGRVAIWADGLIPSMKDVRRSYSRFPKNKSFEYLNTKDNGLISSTETLTERDSMFTKVFGLNSREQVRNERPKQTVENYLYLIPPITKKPDLTPIRSSDTQSNERHKVEELQFVGYGPFSTSFAPRKTAYRQMLTVCHEDDQVYAERVMKSALENSDFFILDEKKYRIYDRSPPGQIVNPFQQEIKFLLERSISSHEANEAEWTTDIGDWLRVNGFEAHKI